MPMYRVAVEWTGPSSPLITQLFFDVAAGGTPQQTATAVATFMGSVDNQVSNAYSWSLDQEVRQINEANGQLQSVVTVTAASGTGFATGERLDLLQGIITWTTGEIVNGRVLRGRMFCPGVTENFNASTGIPETTAYKTPMDAAAAALIADTNTKLVVWHRPTPIEGGGNQGDGEIGEVIGGSLNSKWGYLTSRRI